eukprot:666181-Amphidinium_carterae.1
MQQKAEICTLAELLGAEQQLVMARISISELLTQLPQDARIAIPKALTILSCMTDDMQLQL